MMTRYITKAHCQFFETGIFAEKDAVLVGKYAGVCKDGLGTLTWCVIIAKNNFIFIQCKTPR